MLIWSGTVLRRRSPINRLIRACLRPLMRTWQTQRKAMLWMSQKKSRYTWSISKTLTIRWSLQDATRRLRWKRKMCPRSVTGRSTTPHSHLNETARQVISSLKLRVELDGVSFNLREGESKATRKATMRRSSAPMSSSTALLQSTLPLKLSSKITTSRLARKSYSLWDVIKLRRVRNASSRNFRTALVIGNLLTRRSRNCLFRLHKVCENIKLLVSNFSNLKHQL